MALNRISGSLSFSALRSISSDPGASILLATVRRETRAAPPSWSRTLRRSGQLSFPVHFLFWQRQRQSFPILFAPGPASLSQEGRPVPEGPPALQGLQALRCLGADRRITVARFTDHHGHD